MSKLNFYLDTDTIMKVNAITFVALMAWMSACSPQQGEGLEEKKQQLAEYKKEFNLLKSKIDKLEAELVSLEDKDPTANLKQVEVLKLAPGTFNHYIEVQGNVKSSKNVSVNPEVSGILIRRHVEEGTYVKKGQVLASIDAEVVRNNIAEMETELELATNLYNRQKNLWDRKIGSEVQYLEAKNRKESLEKKLATLKTQLSKTYVKSPISGTVDEFFVNSGEMVSPSAPVVRVVNLANVEVNAEVSEAYTTSVRQGDSVEVSFPVLGLERKEKIRYIGKFINPQNRTFRIELMLNNKEGFLKPNSMAVVKINDFQKEEAITVPSQLIQKSVNNNQKFLYAVRAEGGKNLVKKLTIETGKSYKGMTLIQSGLLSGDMVITKGFNEVIDGEEVKIVNQQKQDVKITKN
ncbi:efflux RND transporter periplasmic adaptor subunit [Rapidithrix thailandica]|uniref:Efflux RND transporter periplasmic adaptor subunit n=1 Tax=Rapidithrix thailandica TaxID=413964 RepID=A0AAW9S585_9BACT